MKQIIKYRQLALILINVLLLSFSSYAQDSGLEHVGNFGTIDWVGRKIVAKGIGAPPARYYGKPQARPNAMRAAVTDARRNLLEVIKGVYIDSTTLVNNYMVKDDTIVSKVRGILQNSSIDNYRYMSDGTVEAEISIPLTGQLGEVLNRMAVQQVAGQETGFAGSQVEKRITNLEHRVKAIEDRLTMINRTNLEQEQMILLFKQLVMYWKEHASGRAAVINAKYPSNNNLLSLEKKLDEQQVRLGALASRLDEMARRMTSLEASVNKTTVKPAQGASIIGVKYTGLVIDARETNFRPCLKPEIFSQGKLIYPGEYINMGKAVRSGMVRYYRKIGRAQQSVRAGSLPYTIKAEGTWKGKRRLKISEEAYKTIQLIIETPNNFMSNCKVVIVF